jgi:hypothetical protein
VSTAAQILRIFAAILVGEKLCTVTLAGRIAASLRKLQASLPAPLLAQAWGATDATARALIEKLLSDTAAGAGSP